MNFDSLIASIKGTPLESLEAVLTESFLSQINHGDLPRWQQLLDSLPSIQAESVNLSASVVLGSSSGCSMEQQAQLTASLQSLIPWRKGPFSVFGIEIDSEWKSDMKWDRVLPHIAPLSGRKVLDVGCGNGYHCFRMLGAGAELVVGIDPHIAYVIQFLALKHFVPEMPIYVVPASLEQLPPNLNAFDSVVSMGVIYHRRSPIDHLLQLKSCLRKGGELVLESLYVDGNDGYCLMPEGRYARMSNVWFIPSIKTLVTWLKRCGYYEIQVVSESVTTEHEQRTSPWMPFDSLSDSIQSNNKTLTIENMPAPRRVIVTARTKLT
jgi:tRNA (mo5U34)-methyltransferase